MWFVKLDFHQSLLLKKLLFTTFILILFSNNKKEGKMGEIIGVISIKGGVGKTTTVVNLATVLTKEFGKKVLIVDANFSAPNLGLHLGIIQPEQTIHDVLLDKIGIEHAIIEHKIGFHVIPASLTNKPVRTYKLKQKLAPLKEHYDTIIIDSSPNLNDEILATKTASDK